MTADPFLKVSVRDGDVLIRDRTGQVLLRITGKTPLEAIRKGRRVFDGLAEARKAVDVPAES